MSEKGKQYPSRDLTFAWEHRAYERLADVAEKIDNKAIALFSIGSLIMGIFASMVKGITFDWTAIPLLLSALSYMFLVWQTVKAFWSRKIIVSENPAELKKIYWELEPDEAKEKYWQTLEESAKYNSAILDKKGKALYLAIPALGTEIILLALWLFIR